MQSYKLQSVSEHLKDRHPYIEPPFKERYDSSEVYHAVFDRSVPKLIEILLMPDIEQFKYRDALITLNEMVSHQEMKDDMITQGLVSVSSAYLHHDIVEIRREAVLLLGSLVTIKRGREQLSQLGFDGLAKMLFDPKLLAREACGWAICRIVTGRDGVDILAKSRLIEQMIKSFMQYTTKPTPDVAKFDIYLLEAFSRILQYDNGIQFFIRCGMVKRLNEILKNTNDNFFDQNFTERVNYLCLDCLAKICANHDGKQEGIDEQIIMTASEFLDSPILGESWYSTILVMNCTIHLDGKKQCVHIEDDKIIIVLGILYQKKLIGLLDTSNLELRRDVKQSLSNIAEYPEGFSIITAKLASNFKFLNDLFGPKVVIPLANLLPRTSILTKPPNLPQEQIEHLKTIALALATFLRDYDDALKYAIEQTVKIQEKLVLFLPYRQLTDVVAHSLYRIAHLDQGCREGLLKYRDILLKRYIIAHGDVVIDVSKTTLKEEIKSYKKLHEVLIRS